MLFQKYINNFHKINHLAYKEYKIRTRTGNNTNFTFGIIPLVYFIRPCPSLFPPIFESLLPRPHSTFHFPQTPSSVLLFRVFTSLLSLFLSPYLEFIHRSPLSPSELSSSHRRETISPQCRGIHVVL